MAKIRINKRKLYRESLRTYVTLSRVLINKLDKFFKKYSNKAVKTYKEIGYIPSDYYDDFSKDLYNLLERNTKRIIQASSMLIKTSRPEKKQEDEVASVTYDYVTTRTAENVTYISETTRKQIQSSIALSISKGLGQDDTAEVIKDSVAFSTVRSKVIARTETHQAFNYGNFELAKKLQLPKPMKEWLPALDTRTRSWHSSMVNNKKRLDEDFELFAPSKVDPIPQLMSYTGDSRGGASNVVNCRCFTMYYDDNDVIVE